MSDHVGIRVLERGISTFQSRGWKALLGWPLAFLYPPRVATGNCGSDSYADLSECYESFASFDHQLLQESLPCFSRVRSTHRSLVDG